MSNNYPDGVTGNEYEIAGPSASVLQQRTCEALISWVPTSAVKTSADLLLRQVRSGEGADLVTIFSLQNMDDHEHVVEMACGFDDEVELVFLGRGLVAWTCPRCGAEHEEEDEPEDER